MGFQSLITPYLKDIRNIAYCTAYLSIIVIAILIVKIVFLKVRLKWAFKKTILVFPAPLALETLKSVSLWIGMIFDFIGVATLNPKMKGGAPRRLSSLGF
jgi:hypothetical protein